MVLDDASASSLEQFTLLAKNARGRACVALIQQALSNKKLFVFRELLDMPNVQALAETEHDAYLRLLQIFCFGTYRDYTTEKDTLPALTPPQVQKLQKLTVVTLAQASKVVPYSLLLTELGVSTTRELEDIVIDAIYAGLVHGKLDQKSQSLLVKHAVGRDIQNSDIDAMIEKLTNWKSGATAVRLTIEDILSNAEKAEAFEAAREEEIRGKIARLQAEQMKNLSANLMAGPFHPDDFALADSLGMRRVATKRMHPGGPFVRKGRM